MIDELRREQRLGIRSMASCLCCGKTGRSHKKILRRAARSRLNQATRSST